MASIKASTVQFNTFASFALNDLPKTKGDTAYRCLKGGEWYNDDIIEGRFTQNPDPQFFKKGRLS